MKKIFLIAAFAAAFFSVSAIVLSCEKKSKVRDDSLAGDWVLTSYEKDGQNVAFPSEAEEFPLSLSVFGADEVENGFRIGGFSGVNNFMGGAHAYKDGSVSIEFNASTMKAGLPEDEDFERNYIKNMKSVTNVAFKGNTMTLSGENVKFTFERKQ